jgi:hypothetical protein
MTARERNGDGVCLRIPSDGLRRDSPRNSKIKGRPAGVALRTAAKLGPRGRNSRSLTAIRERRGWVRDDSGERKGDGGRWRIPPDQLLGTPLGVSSQSPKEAAGFGMAARELNGEDGCLRQGLMPRRRVPCSGARFRSGRLGRLPAPRACRPSRCRAGAASTRCGDR